MLLKKNDINNRSYPIKSDFFFTKSFSSRQQRHLTIILSVMTSISLEWCPTFVVYVDYCPYISLVCICWCNFISSRCWHATSRQICLIVLDTRVSSSSSFVLTSMVTIIWMHTAFLDVQIICHDTDNNNFSLSVECVKYVDLSYFHRIICLCFLH